MNNVSIFEVCLPSVNDVKLFVNLTTQMEEEVDVLSGRYVVDGKSIMALFSVDLNKPVKVIIHGGEEAGKKFQGLAKGKFTMSQLK